VRSSTSHQMREALHGMGPLVHVHVHGKQMPRGCPMNGNRALWSLLGRHQDDVC
jgi:hypothetical protein